MFIHSISRFRAYLESHQPLRSVLQRVHIRISSNPLRTHSHILSLTPVRNLHIPHPALHARHRLGPLLLLISQQSSKIRWPSPELDASGTRDGYYNLLQKVKRIHHTRLDEFVLQTENVDVRIEYLNQRLQVLTMTGSNIATSLLNGAAW